MDLLEEHFNMPRNRGEIDAGGTGIAGDEGCGARIRVQVAFGNGFIQQAAFEAEGSRAAVAAGSLITSMIAGGSWLAAAALPAATLSAKLGGREALRGAGLRSAGARLIATASGFAVDALHAALTDAARRGTLPALQNSAGRVLVAMSGGVDSSVACLLEQRAGREVVGVTMRLAGGPGNAPDAGAGCCSPDAERDARAVCHQLGLPHLTVDYTGRFREKVIDGFVEEYVAGRTPNPCAACNASFRFPALMELARGLGAGSVATGHYARLAGEAGALSLARAADESKDQTYMLWGVAVADLERIRFPLSEIKKDETRRRARAAGLVTGDRPESQDICFIPEGDYRRFLRDYLRAREMPLPGEGDVVDSAGNRIGSHQGYLDYTVGQRRGLGGGAAEPLYVLRTIPERNIVVAGTRPELDVSSVVVGSLNVFSPVAEGETLQARLRYNSPPVPAHVITGGDTWRLQLGKPVTGVAPGQSAVLYRDGAVAAGGVIVSTA